MKSSTSSHHRPTLLTLALTLATPLFAACGSSGGGGTGGTTGAVGNVVIEDANNYTSTSGLNILIQ